MAPPVTEPLDKAASHDALEKKSSHEEYIERHRLGPVWENPALVKGYTRAEFRQPKGYGIAGC